MCSNGLQAGKMCMPKCRLLEEWIETFRRGEADERRSKEVDFVRREKKGRFFIDDKKGENEK